MHGIEQATAAVVLARRQLGKGPARAIVDDDGQKRVAVVLARCAVHRYGARSSVVERQLQGKRTLCIGIALGQIVVSRHRQADERVRHGSGQATDLKRELALGGREAHSANRRIADGGHRLEHGVMLHLAEREDSNSLVLLTELADAC